ncbi:MAG: DNA polymerase III subunit beta, partial [Clostridia bacterium]|nr:DNA polymerase III subunit beta [Clostridia bacterium]
MKFICNKKDLISSVSSAQRAVAVRSVNPSLEGMFLKTSDGKVEIYGYDMEMGVKTFVNADIINEGSIILNARVFSDIVRNLPDNEVTVDVDENFMTTIKSGMSLFSIMGLDPVEYPSLPYLKDADTISVEQSILKNMIKQTIFAVSTNESKPVYTGCMFELLEDKFKLVSVDGCRMAIREEKIVFDKFKKNKFIVPSKTLNEISRLIDDDSNDIKISFDKKYVTFEIGNYFVISRLIEGQFLDYNAAIPKEFNTQVIVSVSNLVESIERVSLLINDKVKFPIRCLFENNQIKISCMTAVGKANDLVNADIKGSN